MKNAVAITILACGLLVSSAAPAQTPAAPKPAEPTVGSRNRAVRSELPFADRQDFDDATRGFVATVPNAANPQQYQFLDGDAPETVNPSLWRLAQLNAIHGLFTVVAVVYTHSHSDHYGGAKGVATEADVAAGRTKVYAPAGFLDAAVSESIIAGNAMSRRAQFQFGAPLPRGPQGTVDAGLGKIDSRGGAGRSIIAPTDSITLAVDARTIDGVAITFHLAPASEAPAEMHLYFPQMKVLDTAENATHTLHNLLPLRGTEVRDAKGWSRYLGDALDRFEPNTDIVIAQHHWPVWGHDNAVRHLEQQRDLYRYVHDQTVRVMNQGMAPTEIAEALRLPAGLENVWAARGYYGTLSHDSKAVYQKYLGWYDGNPSLDHAALTYVAGKTAGRADASVSTTRAVFNAVVLRQRTFAEAQQQGAMTVTGNAARLTELMSYFDDFDPAFTIVEPRRGRQP